MRERVLLPLILLLALVLRVGLLLGPFREIDADEAVVGLMALQIPAELPVFFWGQQYLGSVEAFVAAGLFALFGPSAAALKLAPALFSVLFVWLTYLTARRAFGVGPALLTALYLAVPPSFLAAWSVKARGGYAELLAFGALVLLACQHLADDDAPTWRWAALAGLAGGLALWTHPLGIVYLAAGGLYVLLARRSAGRREIDRPAGPEIGTPAEVGVDAPAAGLPGPSRGQASRRAGAAVNSTVIPSAARDHCTEADIAAGRSIRRSFAALRMTSQTTTAPQPFRGLVLVALSAFLVGFAPALVYNLSQGFPSLRFAADGGTEPGAVILNLWGLVRYGLPVLVGLAEGSPTRELLDQDWPYRPGSSWLVTIGLPVLGLVVVWWARRSLVDLVRARGTLASRQASSFVLLLIAVVASAAVTRFANLLAEPRYALPIYSAIPLFAAAAWALRPRSRAVFGALAAGVLVLNLASLLTSNYRLSLPVSAGESTAANRAILIDYLLDRGIDRIYTDYWLAYPIAFESGERVVPGVRSGGFSRRASYSHLAWTAENPAFVFAVGTPGDEQFRRDLAAVGGTAEEAEVSVYRVYTRVRPLDQLRRP